MRTMSPVASALAQLKGGWDGILDPHGERSRGENRIRANKYYPTDWQPPEDQRQRVEHLIKKLPKTSEKRARRILKELSGHGLPKSSINRLWNAYKEINP